MKMCGQCKTEKQIKDFNKRAKSPDGFSPICKPCKRLNDQNYYKENKTAVLSRVANYAKENKDKINLYWKSWYRSHRAQHIASCKRTEAKTPGIRAIWSRNWKQSHPENVRSYKSKRRAQSSENYTAEEWRALCEKYSFRCVCCGEPKPLTVDHVIPLSRNGTNAISNIQPLCIKDNLRKGTKIIDYRK